VILLIIIIVPYHFSAQIGVYASPATQDGSGACWGEHSCSLRYNNSNPPDSNADAWNQELNNPPGSTDRLSENTDL